MLKWTLGFPQWPIVVDASSSSWMLKISPFSTLAGIHDGATAPHEREDDGPLLPRVVRLRLGHWSIGQEDFVTSWAVRSNGPRPLKRFNLAPRAQLCIFLPPDASADFGNSPSTLRCSPAQGLTPVRRCRCATAPRAPMSSSPASATAGRSSRCGLPWRLSPAVQKFYCRTPP